MYGIEWQVTQGIRNNTTKRKMVVTIFFFCVTSPNPFDFLRRCFSIKPSGNNAEEIWRTKLFFPSDQAWLYPVALIGDCLRWWLYLCWLWVYHLAKVDLNLILTRPLKYRWWKCKDLEKNQRLDIDDVYGFWLRYVTRNWHLGSWKMAEEYV